VDDVTCLRCLIAIQPSMTTVRASLITTQKFWS